MTMVTEPGVAYIHVFPRLPQDGEPVRPHDTSCGSECWCEPVCEARLGNQKPICLIIHRQDLISFEITGHVKKEKPNGSEEA